MTQPNVQLDNLPPELRAKLLAKLAERSRQASKNITLHKQPADWLRLDQRSLLSLFAAGEEAPVDAVSITCMTDRVVGNGVTLSDVTHKLCGDLPMLTNIRELSIGRIATLTLPRTHGQIYAESQDVVRLVEQSLNMAALIGAKTVSLTGLIPSATEYGRAVRHREGQPTITTGHATTTSSVLLALKRLLEESGRHLADEDLCFIGLGSIGTSTLRLMLNALDHPKSLTLCDVYAKQADIEALMREIREDFEFTGNLRFTPSQRTCPDEVYEATVVVGATNAPNVLDIHRVKPGTLVVDDSDPHCFDAQQAIERFENCGDILFTEGGALRSPDVVKHTIYVPEQFEWALQYPVDDDNAHHITGCIFSSLLSAKYGYPRTLGMVSQEDAWTHLSGLVKYGFTASNLHCGPYRLQRERIDTFRRQFGHTEARPVKVYFDEHA
ncbi:amino acid adenylation protein [Chitinivorax sp. B]|uniref:amino acid adenylation protein n=1 Tax=Chitinivorax sp. B TaxID=2502235 RepID=UPI001BB1C409|nr:amino acid adenylation protein [Chitinivorax sp. B]